jgi:osmotically-inducible protein OsmY
MCVRMKFVKVKFVSVMLLSGLATASLPIGMAEAQQRVTANAPGAAIDAPATTTDQSMTVEHDQVRTSAEHRYNSPAERAKDDLLITEVKSSLAERGISDQYPVEVDCDHGTIQLSGVVATADDARKAEAIALNTRGVVGVKDKLTWR